MKRAVTQWRARSLIGLLSAACLVVVGCEQLAGIEDLQGRPPGVATTPDGGAAGPGEPIDPTTLDSGTGGEIEQVLVDAGTITPTLAFPRRLSLGNTHSCVIEAAASPEQRVLCWGSNANGQLGKGAKPTSEDAVAIPGVDRAKSIAAGGAHTCAIDEDGAILCWGRADFGQLAGNPAELGGVVRVNGPSMNGERVRQVVTGARHTCALLEKSGIRCWGDNAFGQLGDGTKNSAPIGTLIAPLGLGATSGIVAVFAGGFFTCALKKNGAVSCWGDNTFGQIGDRTKQTRLSPVPVMDLAPQLREVALGQNAACVVVAGGSLQCWGRNRPLGETGVQHGIVSPFPPSPAELTSPSAVGADAGVALLHSVALNANHACARSLSGHALCWGSNAKLQLGVVAAGVTPSQTTGFHDVSELAGVVKEIAVGFSHSCALAIDDDVYCWGGNEYGQLGTPAGASRAKPERVASVKVAPASK